MASERHAGSHFQPYVVDVEVILKKNDEEIFSDIVRKISVGEGIEGTVEVSSSWKVALEEKQDYTALAVIYLHENGIPHPACSSMNSMTGM